MDLKNWIEALSASLVPIVAIGALWIAVLQHRTNELRRKHELFDRRMVLYQEIAEFFSSTAELGDLDMERFNSLMEERMRSYFLFGKDVHDYLEVAFDQAMALQNENRMLTSQEPLGIDDQANRQHHYKARDDLWRWFVEEQYHLPESPFKRYLRID